MEIVATPYRCLPCSLQVFTINGNSADLEDFGGPDIFGNCMNGSCCCRFEPSMPKQNVLDKYGITLDEYAEIVEVLKDSLRVDGCGWCS